MKEYWITRWIWYSFFLRIHNRWKPDGRNTHKQANRDEPPSLTSDVVVDVLKEYMRKMSIHWGRRRKPRRNIFESSKYTPIFYPLTWSQCVSTWESIVEVEWAISSINLYMDSVMATALVWDTNERWKECTSFNWTRHCCPNFVELMRTHWTGISHIRLLYFLPTFLLALNKADFWSAEFMRSFSRAFAAICFNDTRRFPATLPLIKIELSFSMACASRHNGQLCQLAIQFQYAITLWTCTRLLG